MFKFFRSIRQKLLAENRFTKYLIYAVGEIVLVVIGILIALQINNSNEYFKAKKKELVLLTELRQNLNNDLNILNGNFYANKEKIRCNEVVKHALETNLPWNDSLKYHFGNIWGNLQMIENTSAWENLKSIGLDLISNNSLRNSISELYSTKYIYLENVEKGYDDNFQLNQLYGQLLRHVNIDTMWVSGTPEDYAALLRDREFREVVKMNIHIRKFMQNMYSDVHQAIVDVMAQLEEHIEYLKVNELGRAARKNHRFTLNDYPADAKVKIAGSFNDWAPEDMVFGNGVWQKEVELTTDEVYYYKFVIDGTWHPDPENPLTQDDRHGGRNSVIIINSDE